MTETSSEPVFALRSADPMVMAQVREIALWWEARVVVRPPGVPPPPADVHLDSVPERGTGDPSWGDAIPVSAIPTPQAFHLPDQSGDLVKEIARALRRLLARRIGVMGGRGGIGTSVLSALLAREYAHEATVTLVDLAGGLDLLIGVEHEPGPRWADLLAEAAPFVGERLRAVLPERDGVAFLGTDERGLPEVGIRDHVAEALTASSDIVVADLGRIADPPPWCDDLLVVTTAEPAAAAPAAALVRRLDARGTDDPAAPRVHIVVRRLRSIGVSPHEVAEACGRPLAGALPDARRLTADLAHGMRPGDRPRSPLVRAVRDLVRDLESE